MLIGGYQMVHINTKIGTFEFLKKHAKELLIIVN